MKLILTFVSLITIASAAMTFTLGAHETACFGVFTEKPRTAISYYFAVQSGGSFDIDFSIKNPRGEIVDSDTKQRQGDFVFNADLPGEYMLCFQNGMSTYADKVIDFEIKAENEDETKEFRANMPAQPNAKPMAHVESMSKTADRIDQQLDGLLKTIQYYKTRNNRNQATVKSTESRIYYFSIFEVLLMVGMAGLQITVVQLFFKGSRKQLV